MWLDVKELSSYIKIKEKTLYALVAAGKIPHYRVGKLVRFQKVEIDEWMQTKKAKSSENRIDKIVRSFYNASEGKPSRLEEEVGSAI
jgi:excisionase family DNA binding protein